MYVLMHIELPSTTAHRIAEVFLTETFFENMVKNMVKTCIIAHAMQYIANECIAAVFNL